MNSTADPCRAIHGMALAVLFCLFPSIGRCQIYCEKPSVNAGQVFIGTYLTQRFVLVNRGQASIEILEAKASCGCLSPRLDRRCLQPAEQGTLELEINTLSQASGPNTWTVRLRYQEAESARETTLQLNANLVSEVMVQPAAMVLLADKSAGHEIVVSDTRRRPFKVSEVRSDSGKLTAQITNAKTEKEQSAAFKIALDIHADYPDGRHNDVLHIYTDDPKYAEMRVPITIIKTSQKHLIAMPGEINLTAVAAQQVPSRLVLIRDQDRQQVKIANVITDDPAITCRWAEGPSTMATLKIQVNRALIHGKSISSAVQVQVASPIHETLIIPVHCTLPQQ